MNKVAKSKRPQAERAGEWVLRLIYGCVVTRRALRTKYAKVDFFAADIIGKRADGSHIYCQITAGQEQAVRIRRKKLDAYPWHVTDTVYVMQLVERQSVINPRQKDWFFRVYERRQDGTWTSGGVSVGVVKEWFRAYRETEGAE